MHLHNSNLSVAATPPFTTLSKVVEPLQVVGVLLLKVLLEASEVVCWERDNKERVAITMLAMVVMGQLVFKLLTRYTVR
jgi:hypothetical protein